jgi:tetratricopeptide (TPR) repeat protein
MLEHPWRYGILLGGIIYFGSYVGKLLPITANLIKAVVSGSLKWPGPIVHDPDSKVNLGRRLIGLPTEHLLPEFIFFALGLLGAFGFSLLTFLSGTSLLSDRIFINWAWGMWLITLVVFISGGQSINKLGYLVVMVSKQLSNISSNEEPRQVDGLSAEAEYAIEHPLISIPVKGVSNPRALELFNEATTYTQSGEHQNASLLYQEALKLDPEIHSHARIDLTVLLQNSSNIKMGSIYYWLGVHSEYLAERVTAKEWYEKSVQIFCQLGYKHREARAHCNLGNVKMQLMDSSAMDEFERAITLNPRNGTAHINIGTIYYGISERGDPRFDRAMNAFADAIIADPVLYGPIVISRLREIGYTWKEDLEDITQRVEMKRR